MKQVFILSIFIFSLVSCKETPKEKIDNLPEYDLEKIENIINNPQTAEKDSFNIDDMAKLKIVERTFQFDTINQGEKVSHSFKIINEGKKDLIFLDISTSCGCTVAKKPEKSLAPGETSFIDVVFDSDGKYGVQSRKISIFTNSFLSEDYMEMAGFVLKK